MLDCRYYDLCCFTDDSCNGEPECPKRDHCQFYSPMPNVNGIGYGPDVALSVEVGNQHRDWLGNTRQSKGHGTLDVRVGRMTGDLLLCHDGHEVEGTVEEIAGAVALMERLRRLGIEVGDGTITVPLPKSEVEVGE